MSNDWNDLEQLWRALPEKAAPATIELKRLQRWRWASYAMIGGEALMSLIGLAAGVWLLSLPSTFTMLLGVATIVFVLLVAALSWWARSIEQVRLDDPVAQAVAIAIRRARVGVRLAVASQWAVVLGLLFTTLMTLGRSLGADTGSADTRLVFMVIAFTQIWLAVCLAWTILYQRKRTHDLARLEALARDLDE